MKQEEYQEILKDCAEFSQTVNSALQEYQTNGRVGDDTHKEVCDNFADIVIALSKNLLKEPVEMLSILQTFRDKADEYCDKTGNYMNINAIFDKLETELADEIKKYLTAKSGE